ncbi:hypothetical protein N7454_003455 [Penicillium verhagenii]|nr:hypothetical protein N7454_003455 [Penicillium verhagenii]
MVFIPQSDHVGSKPVSYKDHNYEPNSEDDNLPTPADSVDNYALKHSSIKAEQQLPPVGQNESESSQSSLSTPMHITQATHSTGHHDPSLSPCEQSHSPEPRQSEHSSPNNGSNSGSRDPSPSSRDQPSSLKPLF